MGRSVEKHVQEVQPIPEHNIVKRVSGADEERRRWSFRSGLAALCLLTFGAAAQAQSVDWVTNLTDAGFDPVTAGGTIEYGVRIDNDGFDLAPATTVTFAIPATTTFTGATGALTDCTPASATGPASVTCDVPPIASSGSVSAVVSILTSSAGSVVFSASVPTTGDILPSNNSLSETTTITAGADMELLLTAPASAASGSTITYSFEATNNGPNAVSGLTLAFPIPPGIANVTPPAGCTLAGGSFACTIAGPVAPGASVTRDFQGQVSASSGSTVTAVGDIGGGSVPDPIANNNTAVANTVITGGTDLSITKARSPSGSLLVGANVTFTLGNRYTGDSPSSITVTDTIPDNYSIGSVTAPGWIVTVTGQTVTATRASGSGAGSNVDLGNIVINTTAVSAGAPVNTATIAAAGPVDQNPANNTASDGGVTISDPVVDLRANKSGPVPPLVVAGNSYSFAISTSNIGNAPFVGLLEMTDTIPAGLTVTALTLNGWTCTPSAPLPLVGPATIDCERVFTAGAPLAAGATSPSVILTTTATGAGSIVNSLTVGSPDLATEPNFANNTITYEVTGSDPADSADIGVLKTATLASVAAGEIQTYRIEVTNAGAQPSTAITLTDDLTNLINSSVGATGAGLVGVTTTANAASGLSCSTASTGGTSRRLTCSITTLPVCTTGVDCPVIEVQVRPGGNAGARSNTASAISSAVADPALGNNSATANFSVEARADVTVEKSDTPDPATAGQNLTYIVTARNLANGLSAAENVTITDTLPENLTFVSATPSNGSCATTPTANTTTGAASNNQVICNLGTISNGAQQTVTIVVRPNLSTRGTTLTNSVDVTTSTVEIDLTNNSFTEDTTILEPVLDLIVNKTDSIDPLPIGDDTVYTVTVANLGPSAAENVVATDIMPSSILSYRSHTVSGGGVCGTVPAVDSLGGTLECTFAVIPGGESRTIQITARGVAKGVGTNAVSISSDETALLFETNLANNDAAETTTVRTRADVEVVSKTAVPGTVDLRDPFVFEIVVRNNTGTGLAEADEVVVTDSLPAGIELTGPPIAIVTAGTATSTVCTGGAGATSFSCNLGTLSSGGAVLISVPVRVIEVTTTGQVFTNTATVATISFDANSDNNSNSGPVTINASSIAGTVFRDFNDDAVIDGTDTGIAGVTMTLTGTAFDGTPITRTTTTAADGSFGFLGLPEGTYTVTQGAIGEAHLSDGTTTAGSEGGSATATVISAIPLPAATAAIDYLFPKVPVARVGIAKAVLAGPTINVDGSFSTTFRLTVQNLSLEPLQDIELTDSLEGASPLFGAFAALGAPATDPMTPGSYTVLAAPSGSCGGANGSFNGAGATLVAQGFTLSVGATCSLDFTLRIQPTQPLPPVLPSGGRYENQAIVTAEGTLTGQTQATNPQLRDLSQNGTTPDPNGNGIANEPGENTPTPVAPGFAPGIEIVKTADLSILPTPIPAGTDLTFRFTVTNTGNVTLSDVTVTDALPGVTVSGGPVTLAPGEGDTTTFTATFPLTSGVLAANTVTNTATATGTWGTDGGGGPLTVSDDDTVVTDFAGIAVVKTADASGVTIPALVGQTITYSFAVTNTGNVPLADVTLVDPLPDLALTGGPIALLAPGATDSTTFTATYVLTQDDIDAGDVVNQATATGTYGTDGGTPITVSDLSGATPADDDPTVVPLSLAARLSLIKSVAAVADTNGNGLVDAGDVVTYAFTVRNTGTVRLDDVTVSDPIVAVSGGPLSLAPGATDSTSITASYALTQADVDRGFLENSATATGNAVRADGTPILDGSGAPITASDVSDAGTDPDGNTVSDPEGVETPDGLGNTDGDPTNDPTVVLIAPGPGLSLIKSLASTVDANGNGIVDEGDTLVYGFIVTNTGNVRLADITIDDPLVAVTGGPIALDPGGTDDTTFTASYVVVAADVARGYIENSAIVIGAAVRSDGTPILDGGGAPITVSDVSDAGTDPAGNPISDPEGTETPDGAGNTDGDPTNDPTVVLVGLPEITLSIGIIDIVDTNNNGIPDAGDVILYSFTVANTGQVPLFGANMDFASLSLPLPGLTCAPVDLPVGASVTLTCTGNGYTITPADVAAGTVTLSGTATATAGSGIVVSDDDAVVSVPLGVGGIAITKVADRGTVRVGEVFTYTIEVTNISTVVTSTVDVVDVLPRGFLYRPGTGTLDGAPTEPTVSGRRLVWEDVTLAPGATSTVTLATFVSSSVTPGRHVNTAVARDSISGRPVSREARATVRVEADPVFACGTVIGRVFDDANHDGIARDALGSAVPMVSNQEFSTGKLGDLSPETGPEDMSEPGIPGVRLVTPNGLAVTTDQFGRFSLPCAALPRDIGSNFMLRLDERTLPTGFRVTSENPRVVRLTPGMITRMDFGASLSRVVRVDIAAAAFAGTTLRSELEAGLVRMVTEIAGTPSVLRITYQLAPGEDARNGRTRAGAVEAAVRRLWPANGRYALTVETVVVSSPARAANERGGRP